MIGTKIKQYEIISELGEGGMAEVYKAFDNRLNRFVAIKFLSRSLLKDKTARQRFLREARAASALNHPNIAVIHEIGQFEGRDYIVMEFIDGVTLNEEIEKSPLRLEQAIKIAKQCASALSQAHASGIVHRDIKPDNIMINKEGLVKIMDFGLAKTTQTTRITPIGYALGTPAYMSPEQTQRVEADGRSDIYSLGVVMYEALTGQLPFDGDTEYSIMYAAVHQKPKLLRTMNAQIPKALAEIVETCMAKKPKDRYQTCDELSSDLARVAEELDQGVSGIPKSNSLKTKLRKKKLRRIGVPSAIGLIAVLLLFVFLRILWPILYPEKPRLAVLPIQDNTAQKLLTNHRWSIAYALTRILEQSDQLEVIPHIRIRDAFKSLGRIPDEPVDRQILAQLAEMLQVRYFVWGLADDSIDGIHFNARTIDLPTWKWNSINLDAKNVVELYKNLDSLSIKLRKRLEPGFEPTDTLQRSLAELTTFSINALAAYVEAEKLIGQFDIGPAEVALENAVKFDSTFPMANALLALTKNFHGAHDEAKTYLARAQRHLSNRSEKEKKLVRLLGAWIQDDMEKGLQLAIEMEHSYPKDERVLVNVADMYWNCRKQSDAKRVFHKILKKNPWHLYSLDALASIEMEQANWHAAEKYLKKGVDVAPLGGNSHRSLGYLYFLRGKYWDAITEFQQANLLRHGIASILLGESYQLLGHFAEAATYFSDCLSNPFTQGEDIDATRYLAKQLLKTGQLQDALILYQERLRRHPNNPSLMANMGIVHLARGDTAKCNEILAQLAQKDTSQIWAKYLRAHQLLFAKKYEPAVPQLKEAEQGIESQNTFLAYEIKCKLADSYFKLGRVDMALKLFQTLDDQLPLRPEVLLGLARCYQQKNKPDVAIEYYNKVLDIWSTSAELEPEKQQIKAEIKNLQDRKRKKMLS